jgi:hypothetical protein
MRDGRQAPTRSHLCIVFTLPQPLARREGRRKSLSTGGEKKVPLPNLFGEEAGEGWGEGEIGHDQAQTRRKETCATARTHPAVAYKQHMKDIPLKAKVECADGPCGESGIVILNPETRDATHFVAQTGLHISPCAH